MQTSQSHETAADDLRIAIVVSQYHEAITSRLRQGAVEAFAAAGGDRDRLVVLPAPGTWEVPVIAHALAWRKDVDAVVALGCIITGETTHDQYIAWTVAQALMNISAQTGKPVTFGVLTCQSWEQAAARSGGEKGNKGAEAMRAAIDAALTLRSSRRRKLS